MMDCYTCKHRGSVPGSAHSSCRYPGTKYDMFDFFAVENYPIAKSLNIRVNRHGYVSGWAFWPCNFDPVWIDNCDGYERVDES